VRRTDQSARDHAENRHEADGEQYQRHDQRQRDRKLPLGVEDAFVLWGRSLETISGRKPVGVAIKYR
jgi:hypothetical protein